MLSDNLRVGMGGRWERVSKGRGHVYIHVDVWQKPTR